jgi:hypothetical protein
MALETDTLYDRDFNLWVGAQIEALRASRWQDLDLPNVIEELDSLGRSDRRAIKAQFERLWLHLLKSQHQPQKRTRSWNESIDVALREIFDVLAESPSLRSQVQHSAVVAYARARRAASRETRLPLKVFPVEMPHDYERLAVNLASTDDLDVLDALIRAHTDYPD